MKDLIIERLLQGWMFSLLAIMAFAVIVMVIEIST